MRIEAADYSKTLAVTGLRGVVTQKAVFRTWTLRSAEVLIHFFVQKPLSVVNVDQ
jgi:hypothetical protein